MSGQREVWVEFGDGSVAKYSVSEVDLAELLRNLRGAGMPCRIWVDGRLCPPPEQSERTHEDD